MLVIVAVSINSLQYSSSLELAREHNSGSTQAPGSVVSMQPLTVHLKFNGIVGTLASLNGRHILDQYVAGCGWLKG